MAEGTEAEGAAVALVTVPATITCQDCGLTAETTDVLAVCPGCAGENVEITGGDEMTLESITYEPARHRVRLRGDRYVPGHPGPARGG